MAWLFLSFEGRANRELWWLAMGLALSLDRVFYFMIGDTEGGSYITFAAILVTAIQIAPTVKRLHDVGRSGWWVGPYLAAPLLLFLLAVGSGSNLMFVVGFFGGLMILLWAIFELGFIKGPERDNRYGPDPLR